MPIKFSFKKLPVDESGQSYDSIEAFQAAELQKICPNMDGETAVNLVAAKDRVLEILEISESSRPGARGTKKPRKPKVVQDPPKAATA